jgi:hypothetical protein
MNDTRDGIAYKYDEPPLSDREPPEDSAPLVDWYEPLLGLMLIAVPLGLAFWLGLIVGAFVIGYRLIT